MAAIPSGTVTFLFTDIEGSTSRWEHDPAAMGVELAVHDSVLRSAIGAFDGYIFAAGGDGFAAAFADPVRALHAALRAQGGVGVPVRMGLHTGIAEERDGNYFGRTLNRAARIMAAGHGGQILLSDATAAMLRGETLLDDLGEHQLTGLDSPVRIWQIGGEVFPALRTSSVVVGNLPVALDAFVGRTDELSRLSEMIDRCRLVTVVSVGGMGKTRLVIEAGHRRVVGSGVWFVDLGLVRSEGAIGEQVAAALGVRAAQGQTIEDRLVEYLEPRTAVLVFDNCEHVMSGVAQLVERLLHAAPEITVVATSREALMIGGEEVMPLGPLSVAASGENDMSDAVALFVERVRAQSGSYDPDPDELNTVAEICGRLDGMPLAIELAAARARSLGVTGVSDRLGTRLRLLGGGRRTSVGRHQTLQATLDWSYVLLDAHEQTVFDRLGVFVGWFTLDDAVAVAGGDGIDTFEAVEAISGLVDKSMMVIDRSHMPARYRYLETMRAYAREHLERNGVIAACLTRHASHMAAQAARAQQELVGPDELSAVAELERLSPDLRAALLWSADQHFDAAIEPIAALAPVLMARGSNEMSGWCYEVRDELADNRAVQSTATLHALICRGDLPETRRLIERVGIMTDGDLSAVLFAMGYLAYLEGDFTAAISALERFDAHSKVAGSPVEQFNAQLHLVMMLAVGGFDVRDRTTALVDTATTLRWPSGIAVANYADGLATITSDPVHSLDAYNRALASAIDAANREVEANARRDRLAVLTGILSHPELARELIGLLRLQASTRSVLTSVLTFSQAVQLLESAGRSATAAMICGWLDGRSGRAAFNIGEHIAAVEAVQSSVGYRWEELLQTGRHQTFDQIVEIACDELATID